MKCRILWEERENKKINRENGKDRGDLFWFLLRLIEESNSFMLAERGGRKASAKTRTLVFKANREKN